MLYKEDGRVFFTVPKLFEVSVCLLGPSPEAGWFFGHVEFPIQVQGELASLQGASTPYNQMHVLIVLQSSLDVLRA